MYQDYSIDAVSKYAHKNLAELLKCHSGTMYAMIVEKMSADYDGDRFVGATGYDQINDKTKDTTETKTTRSPLRKTKDFRIGSIMGKQGLFKYLKIIETYNNRVFRIPHDVFFNEALINSGEFRWSATYNKSDKVRPENTQLLLKYEIK